MRNWYSTLALLVLFTASLAAQSSPAPSSCARHVSVTGSAEIRVDPDTVWIKIGVDSQDPVAAKALSKNREAIRRLVGIAREKGVEAEDIQSDYVSLRHITEEPTKGTKRELFEASQTLIVRLRNLSRYSDLLQSLVEAGGNRIDSVTFEAVNISDQKDKARSLAYQAARRKAELLAKEASVVLGKVCTMDDESPAYGYTGGLVNLVTKSGTSEEYNTPGKISISSSVSVTFAIE